MGKGTRNKAQSARQRIAEQQAAARKAETRRRVFLAGGAVVLVIAIVVVFVVIKVSSGGSGTAAEGVNGAALPASVYKNVTTVPESALASVGTGSVVTYNSKPISTISGTALTAAGKPELLYIGAEFCPYCAAERWSMAVALSRFGTLSSPLHGIHSSSTDTDPSTPTLTFYKSTYTSKYLTFTAVENETVTHAALQNTTSAQQAIWTKYSPSGQLGYPFIDFGNKYLINGPQYDPGILAGLTWEQVAQQMRDPSSKVAQGVLGSANYITAAICKMTGGAPASVCSAASVTSMESKL